MVGKKLTQVTLRNGVDKGEEGEETRGAEAAA